MTEYYLKPPISEATVLKLKTWDEIYLSGKFYGGAIQPYIKIIETIKNGGKTPFNLKDSVYMIGGTTSARYQYLTPEFIKHTGIRAITGKGGMNKASTNAMKKYGCVYLCQPGGPAEAVYTSGVVKKVRLDWPKGFVPYCQIIEQTLKEYGPLLVGIDAHGNSIYEDIEKKAEEKLQQLYKRLGTIIEEPYFV